MRRTEALMKVAIQIMAAPSDRFWGYPLSRAADVRSGVLYPLLQRMLMDGWLEDGWEEIDSAKEKRPPRRYYTLTDRGARELGAIAAAVPQTMPQGRRKPRLA